MEARVISVNGKQAFGPLGASIAVEIGTIRRVEGIQYLPEVTLVLTVPPNHAADYIVGDRYEVTLNKLPKEG